MMPTWFIMLFWGLTELVLVIRLGQQSFAALKMLFLKMGSSAHLESMT